MNGPIRGLSTLNDVQIPPLRHLNTKSTSRTNNIHSSISPELFDHAGVQDYDRPRSASSGNEDESLSKIPKSASLDSLTGKDQDKQDRERETKKPHLAISELVDSHLPSFVSLSVVEKSPTQAHLNLGLHRSCDYPHKRPRLDVFTDQSESSHEMNRLLPRPVQKDDKQVIPLLPAMVTGLHEPPPSAALLPSMDLDARPNLQRSATTPSKMLVKDMLSTEKASHSRPPERMLNTPEVLPAELPKSTEGDTNSTEVDTPPPSNSSGSLLYPVKKDAKVRRARRKWSEAESQHLLAGVKKHGFGKWKQILLDPTYAFDDRTSIDLKDRYRVYAKDQPESPAEGPNSDDAHADITEVGPEIRNSPNDVNGASNKRRKRHPWSREEDNALLQGVQKYGFQWTDIHNDRELGLDHRRATDLRDRIRNLYPDGYKHAEARPLRAEVKKAEKAGKLETPAGTLYAPPAQMESINFSTTTFPTPNTASSSTYVTRRQTTSGKVPSIAALTQPPQEVDLNVERRPVARRSRTLMELSEHSGITLPSLALDPSDDAHDWDNTLPPFVNWEHEL